VLLADQDNKVVVRPIELGGQQGSEWIVLGGLAAGDRVIVEGLQKVQPGAVVRIATADKQAKPVDAARPSEQ
jgi:membrane fusion protein (multidrug efflux system)